MLAPVTSVDKNLTEIKAAAGQEKWTYTGVRKTAKAFLNDRRPGSRYGWYNLDGSSVLKSDDVWANTQPDNKLGLQSYGVFFKKRENKTAGLQFKVFGRLRATTGQLLGRTPRGVTRSAAGIELEGLLKIL